MCIETATHSVGGKQWPGNWFLDNKGNFFKYGAETALYLSKNE